MNKSIDILLKSLENQQIIKHIVCPSARLLLSKSEMSLPNSIDIIDERSAGYVATGLCAESEQPVVIWCADNDSYRNLTSALTEAYYRKLPILVVALSCDNVINQTMNPNDTIRYYVNNTLYNRAGTEQDIHKAIDYLFAEVKGPVYLSLGSYQEPVVQAENAVSDQIDVTAITKIIPSSACVHIGKDFVCECSHLCEVVLRNDHCTKDGNLSMLIGSSIVDRNKLHVGIFSAEELAYDLNMFGNRHVNGNIVIFSVILDEQNPTILDVAKRFGWDCYHINIAERDCVIEKLVISDKPLCIEIVL